MLNFESRFGFNSYVAKKTELRASCRQRFDIRERERERVVAKRRTENFCHDTSSFHLVG
jgi:hypothetical protein